MSKPAGTEAEIFAAHKFKSMTLQILEEVYQDRLIDRHREFFRSFMAEDELQRGFNAALMTYSDERV